MMTDQSLNEKLNYFQRARVREPENRTGRLTLRELAGTTITVAGVEVPSDLIAQLLHDVGGAGWSLVRAILHPVKRRFAARAARRVARREAWAEMRRQEAEELARQKAEFWAGVLPETKLCNSRTSPDGSGRGGDDGAAE